MNTEQEVWIDVFVPNAKEDTYIETELARKIFKEMESSLEYPLGTLNNDFEYEMEYWTLYHDVDDDKEDLFHGLLVQLVEFSKKYPEVLFRIDTHDDRMTHEDIRIFLLDGGIEEVEVKLVYGKSRWQSE